MLSLSIDEIRCLECLHCRFHLIIPMSFTISILIYTSFRIVLPCLIAFYLCACATRFIWISPIIIQTYLTRTFQFFSLVSFTINKYIWNVMFWCNNNTHTPGLISLDTVFALKQYLFSLELQRQFKLPHTMQSEQFRYSRRFSAYA